MHASSEPTNAQKSRRGQWNQLLLAPDIIQFSAISMQVHDLIFHKFLTQSNYSNIVTSKILNCDKPFAIQLEHLYADQIRYL